MKKLSKKLNEGFSLMETLIWVGIVGIFSSLVVVSGVGVYNRTKVNTTKAELNTYAALLLDYKNMEGNFPTEDEGLEVLFEKEYVSSGDTNDGWGNAYLYTLSDDGNGFTLKSLGADKAEGGTGTKEDIIVTHGIEDDF